MRTIHRSVEFDALCITYQDVFSSEKSISPRMMDLLEKEMQPRSPAF